GYYNGYAAYSYPQNQGFSSPFPPPGLPPRSPFPPPGLPPPSQPRYQPGTFLSHNFTAAAYAWPRPLRGAPFNATSARKMVVVSQRSAN
ncbi:hypothetical protein H0H92_011365, partial [Tricholoma furcatifolium]